MKENIQGPISLYCHLHILHYAQGTLHKKKMYKKRFQNELEELLCKN